ncbi:hypothetical protein [Leuconostoc citreum]|uniref:hypothetical protein n=1 Tax=Leuconostoc citreum TaxID=33964 RepID=UPI0032DE7D66
MFNGNSKINNITRLLVSVLMISVIVPLLALVKVDTVSASQNYTSSSKVTKNFDYLYNNLSDYKRNQFNQIVQEQNLSPTQQLDLLEQQDNFANEPAPRWKAWLIRKAFETAAKMAGKSASGAMINKWAMTVSGASDSLRNGLSNFLVDLGVNRKVANGIAATAMFVAF